MSNPWNRFPTLPWTRNDLVERLLTQVQQDQMAHSHVGDEDRVCPICYEEYSTDFPTGLSFRQVLQHFEFWYWRDGDFASFPEVLSEVPGLRRPQDYHHRVRLSCGHTFGLLCLANHLARRAPVAPGEDVESTQQCPMCRRQLFRRHAADYMGLRPTGFSFRVSWPRRGTPPDDPEDIAVVDLYYARLEIVTTLLIHWTDANERRMLHDAYVRDLAQGRMLTHDQQIVMNLLSVLLGCD